MEIIYVVCKNKKEAQQIGRLLLTAKLAACINIFPIESMYWWKGDLEKSKEAVLLIKTKKGNFQKIEAIIKRLHSYEIPFIASIKIGKVNKEYLKWLRKEV